jgi:predicted molibdopterin-dependent oxidoreductase YjgC
MIYNQKKKNNEQKRKNYINNKVYEATEGRSVALELFSKNFHHLRNSPKFNKKRGFFCMIGSCQECLITIDNKKILACITKIKEGMKIELY